MIKCLDHGYVRLIDSMGTDLSVVRSARVSYNAEWRTEENIVNDIKLIKFLWKNKHTTPFESVTFTFEVKAPIFIFRQWHRHRTQSYNEVSARYTELPNEFYVPELEIVGTQSKNNKQGRDLTPLQEQRLERNTTFINDYITQCNDAFALYKALINEDWPKELARMVLPVSTYSHMFTTLNLRNLFSFLILRNDPHAQYEIRVYAQALLELITPIVPVCVEAFNESK